MKLAILSTSPRIYSTKRIKETAVARGHDIEVLNTFRYG